MGTLNEKLEYLSQTKEYIKEAIISKGQPVSSSDTFRSYASKIAAIENGDVITATNTTGSAVGADDRVWIEPNVSGEVRNFTVNGNPTINDGTKSISNFSGDNFILFPSINFNEAESWEIHTKFLYDPQASGSNETYLSGGGWSFQVRTNNPSRCTYLLMSSDGESWNLANNLHGSQQLTAGNTYYMKFLFTGSRYELWLSSDGINYRLDSQVSSSNKINQTSETIILGSLGVTNVSSYVRGTIDLNETYTIANNKIVWTSYKPQIVGYDIISPNSVTENSFTAVAQTSIANNASGSVKTILDGNGTYAPTLGTKVITRNNTYSASTDDLYGYSSVTVNVEDIPAVVESLSITPTTSAQSFTPTSGVDGYSPVTVSAVDSSIDANITAGNIKSGVEILGVEGTYSGETSVLQDKVILANGEYTADEGYDGIGTATVAVNATGATEVATNRTGAIINNGDKVWVNQEYYEAGESVEYSNSYAEGNPEVGYSLNDCVTIFDRAVYRSGVVDQQLEYVCHVSRGRLEDVYNIQRKNNGIVFSFDKNGTELLGGSKWKIAGYVPILGSDDLLFASKSENGRYPVIKINPQTGVITKRYSLDDQSYPYVYIPDDNSDWNNPVLLPNGDVICHTQNNYNGNWRRFSLDDINETCSYYGSQTSQTAPNLTNVIFVTSDGKYAINIESVYDLTSINGTSISSTGLVIKGINTSLSSSILQYDPSSDYLLIYSRSQGATPSNASSYFGLYKYNSSTENFDNAGVDLSDIEYNLTGFGVNSSGNLEYIGYLKDYTHHGYLYMDRFLGNNIVNYTSTTNDSITGTAAENISIGGSGNVYIGTVSKLQHEKIIRQNGTYTADTGYDGIASVDVAIGQIGGTYEATNKSGSSLATNDKVWLNYRPVSIDSQIAVTNLTNNINKAFLNPSTDDSIYFNKSSDNCYSISENTFSTSSATIYNTNPFESIFYDRESNSVTYSRNLQAQRIDKYGLKSMSSYAYFCNGHVKTYRDGNWAYVYVNDTIVRSVTYGDTNGRTEAWKDPIDDKYYLITYADNNSLGMFEVDLENNSLITKQSYISISIGSFRGFTSDYKYLILGKEVYRIDGPSGTCTKVSNLGDLTTYYQNHSSCNIYFDGLHDLIVVFPNSGSLKTSGVFKYNPTSELWDQLDVTLPDINPSSYLLPGISCRAQITSDLKTIVCNSDDGTENVIVYNLSNDGGWVITNYNSINQDSLTGYAAETIAAGATGDVIIGEEVENQNKSITSDGSYTADEGYTGLGTVTVTAGAVASAATQNQIAEELMLINDGAVALTINVSPITADFVLTSSTNHIDITPTSSSGGTYVFNISANNLKNYTYSASELGYTTSTGTIVGGTSTFTITLDEESESE